MWFSRQTSPDPAFWECTCLIPQKTLPDTIGHDSVLSCSRDMDEIHYSEFENPNFDAKAPGLRVSEHLSHWSVCFVVPDRRKTKIPLKEWDQFLYLRGHLAWRYHSLPIHPHLKGGKEREPRSSCKARVVLPRPSYPYKSPQDQSHVAVNMANTATNHATFTRFYHLSGTKGHMNIYQTNSNYVNKDIYIYNIMYICNIYHV